ADRARPHVAGDRLAADHGLARSPADGADLGAAHAPAAHVGRLRSTAHRRAPIGTAARGSGDDPGGAPDRLRRTEARDLARDRPGALTHIRHARRRTALVDSGAWRKLLPSISPAPSAATRPA